MKDLSYLMIFLIPIVLAISEGINNGLFYMWLDAAKEHIRISLAKTKSLEHNWSVVFRILLTTMIFFATLGDVEWWRALLVGLGGFMFYPFLLHAVICIVRNKYDITKPYKRWFTKPCNKAGDEWYRKLSNKFHHPALKLLYIIIGLLLYLLVSKIGM